MKCMGRQGKGCGALATSIKVLHKLCFNGKQEPLASRKWGQTPEAALTSLEVQLVSIQAVQLSLPSPKQLSMSMLQLLQLPEA